MLSKIKMKDILLYIGLFIILLFVSNITTSFGSDEIWNYGFAKNIYDDRKR